MTNVNESLIVEVSVQGAQTAQDILSNEFRGRGEMTASNAFTFKNEDDKEEFIEALKKANVEINEGNTVGHVPGTSKINEGLMGEAEAKYDVSQKTLTFADAGTEIGKFENIDLTATPEFSGEVEYQGKKYHFTLEKIDSGYRITMYGDKDGAPDPDNMEVVDQAEVETVVNEEEEAPVATPQEQAATAIIEAIKADYPTITEENIKTIQDAITAGSDSATIEVDGKQIVAWFVGIGGETPDMGYGISTDGTLAGVTEESKKPVTVAVAAKTDEDLVMDELKRAQAEQSFISGGQMLESRLPMYRDNPKLKNLSESLKRKPRKINESEGATLKDKILMFVGGAKDGASPEGLEGQYPNSSTEEITTALAELEKEGKVKVNGDKIVIGDVNEAAGEPKTPKEGEEYVIDWDGTSKVVVHKIEGDMVTVMRVGDQHGEKQEIPLDEFTKEINESAPAAINCPSCSQPLGKDQLEVLRCGNKECDQYGLTAQVDQPMDQPVNESTDSDEWTAGEKMIADLNSNDIDGASIQNHVEKQLGVKMKDISTTDSEVSDIVYEITSALDKAKVINTTELKPDGMPASYKTVEIGGVKVVVGLCSGVDEIWVKTADLGKLKALDIFESVSYPSRKLYEGLAPRIPSVSVFEAQERARLISESADINEGVKYPDEASMTADPVKGRKDWTAALVADYKDLMSKGKSSEEAIAVLQNKHNADTGEIEGTLSEGGIDVDVSEAASQQWYIGERGNPQLPKPYYRKYGQLSKADAKKKEETVYGTMSLTGYNTEEEYNAAAEKLKADGFKVNEGMAAVATSESLSDNDYDEICAAIEDTFGISDKEGEGKAIHIEDLKELGDKWYGKEKEVAKLLDSKGWAIEGYNANESVDDDGSASNIAKMSKEKEALVAAYNADPSEENREQLNKVLIAIGEPPIEKSNESSEPVATHTCIKDWEGECAKGDTGNYDAEEGIMTMLDGKNVGAPLVVSPEILAEYFAPVGNTNEAEATTYDQLTPEQKEMYDRAFKEGQSEEMAMATALKGDVNEAADMTNKIKLAKFQGIANKETESIAFMNEHDTKEAVKFLGIDPSLIKVNKASIKFLQSAAFKSAVAKIGEAAE